MKAQKGLVVLATLSLLGLSVSCADRYAEGVEAGKTQGYSTGYDAGYDDGYLDGDEAGFERAKQYFASSDYNAGFTAGRAEGVTVGYNQGVTAGRAEGTSTGYSQGYSVGKTDGLNQGRNEGYSLGYDDGYDDGYLDGGAGGNSTVAYNQGYAAGSTAGYSTGYDDGYDDGSLDGYDMGYDDGFLDGYDVGYDDGFDDGYGLSVGKSKKLQGYSNLLSMAHNDLIDYSKIAAPKASKKGLSVNGKLLFEETSLTNKDTLKRAAVVEQYLVIEMAKQVKGKFGLSAGRALQIAKAANHFRKQASKRALTAEDTSAYVSEITGTDLGAIVKASESAAKGDVSSFSSIIEAAAKKNEVSPEKMAQIISLF